MKVKVREITRSGMSYEDHALPAAIELVEDFIDQEKEVFVRGYLERVDDFILVKLEVTCTIDTICARCLDNINKEITIALEFDTEFRPGDEVLDIGARVREELLMVPHERVLCKEDCKGICPGCGSYLNEEKCECPGEKNKPEL